MAMFPQDRRGQVIAMAAVLGAALVYFQACGWPIGGIPGVSQLNTTRDSLRRELDSINTQVRNARRDVASGAIQQLEARLVEYRATLDLMRTLVPAGTEIPNLFDDITSRAKIRGATVATFVPQALESGQPFDTQRARLTAVGSYDQIGEFLADMASLPRIVVPYDLRLERIQSPQADTSLRNRPAVLSASFLLRTYVKPAVVDTTGAAAPGGTP